MERILPVRAWLLLGVCLLWNLPAPARAAEPATFISEELLDHTGLKAAWRSTLPLLNKEHIDTMLVLEDRLLVQSNQDYLWLVDRNTGRTIFSQPILPRNATIFGWTVYKDSLFAVIDNRIVEFDKNTGVQRRASDLEFGIVAPVARNSEFFYVPTGDRRFHAYTAKDMVHVFNGAIQREPKVTSILAQDDMVVVGTEDGTVEAMDTRVPRKLWQFDASAGLAGPVVRDGNSFYFASKDTSVYRLDAIGPTQVNFAWRYQAEAILDRAPRVTPGAVYQCSVNRGLSAIDKQRGTALWVFPDGLDLLAEVDGRAYIVTRNGALAVMDNTTGNCIYRANVGATASYAANVADGKIYVADNQGHVVCLQPR
jgi:outer membrane protein assembly factor BamB